MFNRLITSCKTFYHSTFFQTYIHLTYLTAILTAWMCFILYNTYNLVFPQFFVFPVTWVKMNALERFFSLSVYNYHILLVFFEPEQYAHYLLDIMYTIFNCFVFFFIMVGNFFSDILNPEQMTLDSLLPPSVDDCFYGQNCDLNTWHDVPYSDGFKKTFLCSILILGGYLLYVQLYHDGNMFFFCSGGSTVPAILPSFEQLYTENEYASIIANVHDSIPEYKYLFPSNIDLSSSQLSTSIMDLEKLHKKFLQDYPILLDMFGEENFKDSYVYLELVERIQQQAVLVNGLVDPSLVFRIDGIQKPIQFLV